MTSILLPFGLICLAAAWIPAILLRRQRWRFCNHGAWRGSWTAIGIVLLIWGRPISPKSSGGDWTRASDAERVAHVSRCGKCHPAQTEQFLQVSHARTLRRADHLAAFERFSDRSVAVGNPPVRLNYRRNHERCWCINERQQTTIPVDWIFGSGQHGQTPVSIRTDDLGRTLAVEHHVTWYAEHGLDLTIGRPPNVGEHAEDVGNPNDPTTSQKCFGCHTTVLPVSDGRMDLDHCLPGILCARCHRGAEQHALAQEAGSESSSFARLAQESPFDSVKRCGECHRLPTDLAPSELVSENPNLSRFASVGLVLSKCFQLQHTRIGDNGRPIRLDCSTCHDLHHPSSNRVERFNASCLACHFRESKDQNDCPEQPKESNCINCHMPKVPMSVPAHFTDHWIRKSVDTPTPPP